MSELRKSLHDQFVIILTTLSRPVLLYVFSVLRLRESSLPPLRDQQQNDLPSHFALIAGLAPTLGQSCSYNLRQEEIESATKG